MARAGMRLDQWLVAHGHAATRSRAQWMIEAGQVWLNGRPCRKAAAAVSGDAGVTVRGAGLPYVSRGGLKLERALQRFRLEVAGLVALDVGASTGGFTDCLLRHGVRRVYALDVGRELIAPTLREDPRVVVLEGRNLRTFQVEELPEPVDLITIDVSFVSLTLLLPLLPPLVQPYGRVIALVKPQFEVGPARVGRGGIVRRAADRVQALNRVLKAAGEIGFRVLQCVEAPRSRDRGNQEVFISLIWGGAETQKTGGTSASAWQAHSSQVPELSPTLEAGVR